MKRIGDKMYITAGQAAARIGVSPTVLRNWRTSGKVDLPSIMLGGNIYYEHRVIEDYLKELGAVD